MVRFLLIIFGVIFIQSKSSAQDFLLEKLPPTINSGSDEITPVPSRDGQTLFFTRAGFPDFTKNLVINGADLSQTESPDAYLATLREIYSSIAESPVSDPVASAFNQDVWWAEIVGKKFDKTWHAPAPLNNALPNSLVAITPDPNEFLVVNKFLPTGGLERGFSKIRRTAADIWTFPQPIEIRDFYTLTSDVSLTMSFDGKILILSASRGDSRGDMDLYVCFQENENTFSAPQHLGATVNSTARETTPFLSEDNQTLFFSSNRPSSIGGNDIFMAKRLDESWTNWTPPTAVAEPINSVADDSQPYFNMSSGFLYFSSKRDGSSDIFRVQIAPPSPTELTVTGRIINGKTGDLVKDAIVWYGEMGGKANPIIASEGTYSIKIPKGFRMELTGQKPGYTGQRQVVFYEKTQQFFQDNYIVDLIIEPLTNGSLIKLNPIYFEQSKADILSKSYPEIDRLVQFFKENPSLILRVEGHTDNQGRAEDLQKLSEERAVAIKNFLIKKGIDADRIETIGQGAKFPIVDNGNAEMRAENRRTEFRIIKI
jgi:outer membrane protein OmpA-like peptidoglycan-associated protein